MTHEGLNPLFAGGQLPRKLITESTNGFRSYSSRAEIYLLKASGEEQAEAMLNVQKELLGGYQEASRAWPALMKSEVDLWSWLVARLMETRSMQKAVGAYQKCVADENARGGRTTTGRGTANEREQDYPVI